jgi:hypothetical protein
MEGCYHDEDIFAEDEVTLVLTYLNLNNPPHTVTRPTNELSNQQMARQCLLSKRYNLKTTFCLFDQAEVVHFARSHRSKKHSIDVV